MKNYRHIQWSPPEEGWIKINVDASRRQNSSSTFIGYIMRDHRAIVTVASNKVLGDCPILLAECEAVGQAILMTIDMNIPKNIHSDSQLVVTINGKIDVPKEIINLV